MEYTKEERARIFARAREIVGHLRRQSAGDKYLFMSSCIDQLTLDGEDDDRARDICEVLWEEGADLGDYGD